MVSAVVGLPQNTYLKSTKQMVSAIAGYHPVLAHVCTTTILLVCFALCVCTFQTVGISKCKTPGKSYFEKRSRFKLLNTHCKNTKQMVIVRTCVKTGWSPASADTICLAPVLYAFRHHIFKVLF